MRNTPTSVIIGIPNITGIINKPINYSMGPIPPIMVFPSIYIEIDNVIFRICMQKLILKF